MSLRDRISLNYYGILYGPSVTNPTGYQPAINNESTGDPVLLRNFLTAGYSPSPDVIVSGTFSWGTQPFNNFSSGVRDPYARLGFANVINTSNFNLYVDGRVHFPVTEPSRQSDLLVGLQTFQNASYQIPSSRFLISSYTSIRWNYFGPSGMGEDLQLYLGPNIAYQVTPSIAATLIYEVSLVHVFGTENMSLVNNGTDIQPGLSINLTPDLNINPYLNIPTQSRTLRSTSIGMALSWMLL